MALGLLGTDQAAVDVTARRGRRGSTGIRLHRARSLNARDTTAHQGIPITTVARTLLDLAATVRADRLQRAHAHALHLQLYDQRAVDELLRGASGHRGTRALAQATAREPKLNLIRTNGLPEPLVIAPEHGHCEVDLSWQTQRPIVETDSWSAHRRAAAHQAAGIRSCDSGGASVRPPDYPRGRAR